MRFRDRILIEVRFRKPDGTYGKVLGSSRRCFEEVALVYPGAVFTRGKITVEERKVGVYKLAGVRSRSQVRFGGVAQLDRARVS